MQILPVMESVKDAIGYTLSNISLLVKAAMIWVALYTVMVGAFGFMGGDAYMQAIANFMQSAALEPAEQAGQFAKFYDILAAFGTLGNSLFLAMWVVTLLAYYSIAISWHRACLLDEIPPLARFGLLELKYIGYTVLLVLLILIFIGLPYIVLAAIAINSEIGILPVAMPIGLFIFSFLLLGRLSLVFPGIAVRDRRMSFRTSWQATKGNSWRILGGTMLCIMPALVISIVETLLGSLSLPLVILMPVQMILQLLSGAFLLSFMSICYQFLVPSPDAGDLA
ncbi:MAG: hypothetical protein HRU29_07055 [Rhizobiales bacterium]|nr:hypothetical protein [Hyphomicrobiales bacterium]NRB14143.1 hypothetical protein [Hyphomicrobiales bacterium]